jgi:hypothetical protein
MLFDRCSGLVAEHLHLKNRFQQQFEAVCLTISTKGLIMSNSKLISLDRFRQQKQAAEGAQDHPGIMVWLRCPQCNTLEYTEVVAPHGRTHRCGTQVQEVEVPVDLRAELTITLWNLRQIDDVIAQNNQFRLIKLLSKSLDKALIKLKQSEETYLKRIRIAAGRKLEPYPGEINDLAKTLPIKLKNDLGLYISDFRFEPEKRFGPEKKR